MNSQTDCKVVVIGAGYMAREHTRAFQDVPGVQVTGVLSRTQARAEALAVEFNIPAVCTSVEELYEKTLATRKVRAIAMQVLGGGAISPKEAIEYVCKLPNIESILFGASSKGNINETANLIRRFDKELVS